MSDQRMAQMAEQFRCADLGRSVRPQRGHAPFDTSEAVEKKRTNQNAAFGTESKEIGPMRNL